MVQPNDRFKRNPDVVYRRIKGESILLPTSPKQVKTRPFYFVEEVGSRVWELLDGQRLCQGIVKTIAEEFDTLESRVQKEIFSFLNDLKKEGLIQRSR